MPADPVLSRELKSLQKEAAAAQRERATPVTAPAAADRGSPSGLPANDAAPAETAEERALRDQLGEFVDQVTQFFNDTEKNISAHPIESVAGALLIGILIGRLIGRR